MVLTIFERLQEAFQSISLSLNPLLSSPEFHNIGVALLFIWTAIPSQIPLSEVFTVPLLAIGVSPILIIVVATLGTTTGNFFLYIIGKGAHRVVKGRSKKDAQAEHLLHKYRLPIFLVTPFLFFIGDIILVLAGFEKIKFIRILPFLILGEFVRQSIAVYAILGLIEVPKFLSLV